MDVLGHEHVGLELEAVRLKVLQEFLGTATSSVVAGVAAWAEVGWALAWEASQHGWCRASASCGDEVMLLEDLILPVAEACGVVGCLGGGLTGELVLL